MEKKKSQWNGASCPCHLLQMGCSCQTHIREFLQCQALIPPSQQDWGLLCCIKSLDQLNSDKEDYCRATNVCLFIGCSSQDEFEAWAWSRVDIFWMQLFLQMTCCSSLVGFLNVCWHLSNNVNKHKYLVSLLMLWSEIWASSILLI